MFNLIKAVALGLMLLSAMRASADEAQAYRFGHPVSAAEIQPWDIDVRADGQGLPAGSGSAEQGEAIYLQRCAACHGEFGEGTGRFPALIGSTDDLTADRVHKSVGGFWPYSTTLYDYINRAMPFGNSQSLSASQVYALSAYILAMNDIIESDEVMNAHTLPRVVMPNHNGFIRAQGTDIHATACMHQCKTTVIIKSRASENVLNQQAE